MSYFRKAEVPPAIWREHLDYMARYMREWRVGEYGAVDGRPRAVETAKFDFTAENVDG
jgi:hypothetical protein